MPCYDPRNTYDYGRQEAKLEIDNLTRMLCELCTELEKDNKFPRHVVPGLSAWWKEHRELDKIRKKIERKMK